MDNAAMCFCGSGKIKEVCHPKIHDKSRAARVIKLYKTIDDKIQSHYENGINRYPCNKGCSKCCYTDFPFSDIEMDLIMYEMATWDRSKIISFMENSTKIWNSIMKKYPDYVKSLATYAHNNKDLILKSLSFNPNQKNFPCPFMNIKTKECTVYNVRPVTCRTHGTAFYNSAQESETGTDSLDICSKIGKRNTAHSFQADLNELNNQIKSLTTIYMFPYKHSIILRTYPMFYYVYIRYLKNGRPMFPKDLDLKFLEPEENYFKYIYKRAPAIRYK